MNRIFIFLIVLLFSCSDKPSGNTSNQKIIGEAKYSAEIIRDDFGVPHIYGKTDADAVFGLLYAQC